MYCLKCGNIFDVDFEGVKRKEFTCPNCEQFGVIRRGDNGVRVVVKGDFTVKMDKMLSVEYSHLDFEENKEEG